MRKILICLLFIWSWMGLSQGQNNRPMGLPFTQPPGPDTWLFGQAYGNTTGAYNFGSLWYSAGQGLHFGLDFPALCGTPLAAVADGFVAFVDNFSFGSRPHNLILRHPDLGLTTLYGHLLEPAPLVEGQFVQKGQLVGVSGDPDETCDSRPHLHLEVRSIDYRTAYNPIDYIDADWHNLALIGSYNTNLFQQDLDNSRRWMSLDDQPSVAFGGARLNAYNATDPLPGDRRGPSNPPLARNLPSLPPTASATLTRIGYDQCCWNYWWHPTEGNILYTIDGVANQRAAIFRWIDGQLVDNAGIAPRQPASPDASHEIIATTDRIFIRESATGETWQTPSGNIVPGISPDNQRIFWQVQSGTSVPGQAVPPTNIYVADIRGQEARQLALPPNSNGTWLTATQLLITINNRPNTGIGIYDVVNDTFDILGEWYRLRNLTIAPGGEHLMFYLSNQADPSANGVYVLDARAGALIQRLPWFGSWRWRSAHDVYYVPFDPTATEHRLHHYDLRTGEDRQIALNGLTPMQIMNGKWEVSADGRTIAFHNSFDRNLWLLTIE